MDTLNHKKNFKKLYFLHYIFCFELPVWTTRGTTNGANKPILATIICSCSGDMVVVNMNSKDGQFSHIAPLKDLTNLTLLLINKVVIIWDYLKVWGNKYNVKIDS